VQIRQPFGYSGDLCSRGSYEHVRFYVSYDGGATWTDAGVASINVHDIADGRDCTGEAWHPLSYVCGVPLQPTRNFCSQPLLPLVRAILSWEIVPDPNMPDQAPIWGDVHECHVQVRPRPFIFGDIVGRLPAEALAEIPPSVRQ